MSTTDDVRGGRRLAGAFVLFLSALVAVIAANSSYASAYHQLWRQGYRLPGGLLLNAQVVVNKGFMTFFFLAVGLELKRELTHGALRHPRAMALPLFAALGGMILPALVYCVLNSAGPAAGGWGVPMSTDVAFAAGALVLLGRRAPRNLLLFLLALAIVDDVGAILVIALHYTQHLRPQALLWGVFIVMALVVLNRRGTRGVYPYVALGALLWGALWRAGIDAPLAGVLIAAAIPASRPALIPGTRPWTAADRLERRLLPYVTFGVLPLFALGNSDLVLAVHDVTARVPVLLGIFLGLLFGKFCGVAGVAWLVLRLRLADLPTGVTFRHLLGAAWLSGIGFTMALFINTLAFPDGPDRAAGKLAILLASLCAALVGLVWLWRASVSEAAVSDESAAA